MVKKNKPCCCTCGYKNAYYGHQEVDHYDYMGFTVKDVKIVKDGRANELRKLPSIQAL